MTVRILSSAYHDLVSGRAFYEKQGAGLGDYFYDSVFSDIDSLTLYGGILSKFSGYHRLLTRRFPYAVYYKIDAIGDVIVYRVLDCRQNPTQTLRDLGDS
jgi:hypothetical protein